MIKDLTDIFIKGIINSADYNPKDIENKLEDLPNIWCRMCDDSLCNWYLISRSNAKDVAEYYGWLSCRFPVALIMENCPDNIRQLLNENGVITDDFSRKCSCDEDILRQYAPQSCLHIIDDSKLIDGRISFDSEEFITICSYYYTEPYDFDFYAII